MGSTQILGNDRRDENTVIGLNLYKFAKRCKNPNCNELIGTYPCCMCGFEPKKPKNPLISVGYQK